MLSQGFYSLTRTAKRRYFWVVWQPLENIYAATNPDAFGKATSREEALQLIHEKLAGTEAIDLGSAFAQHWQIIFSSKRSTALLSVK
jgi:hypothetical protein